MANESMGCQVEKTVTNKGESLFGGQAPLSTWTRSLAQLSIFGGLED